MRLPMLRSLLHAPLLSVMALVGARAVHVGCALFVPPVTPHCRRRAAWDTLSDAAVARRHSWKVAALRSQPLGGDGALLLEIPLLDASSDSSGGAPYLQPLPSSHLPDELSTPHVYGMEVELPLHRQIVRHAWEDRTGARLLGHVAHKPQDGTWVGAVGCTAQLLLAVPPFSDFEQPAATTASGAPLTVLCRGYHRFVVREVVQSIPYPVALVEELADRDPGQGDDTSADSDPLLDEAPTTESAEEHRGENDDDEDDNEEEDSEMDSLDQLDASELVSQLMRAMNQHVEQQLEIHLKGSDATQPSPLELAILQDLGSDPAAQAQKQATEEMAAVWDAFQSTLVDVAPLPKDRYFSVAILAAELANLPNPVRRQCLRLTDGAERLRIVLREVQHAMAMDKARRAAQSITDATDELQKDLQVGEPKLPSWAMQIRKGMRLEYYWNEEYGWCNGQVVEDPVLIVDELIVTVHFSSDGTTHRLPFTAEEKVRWRPPQTQ